MTTENLTAEQHNAIVKKYKSNASFHMLVDHFVAMLHAGTYNMETLDGATHLAWVIYEYESKQRGKMEVVK